MALSAARPRRSNGRPGRIDPGRSERPDWFTDRRIEVEHAVVGDRGTRGCQPGSTVGDTVLVYPRDGGPGSILPLGDVDRLRGDPADLEADRRRVSRRDEDRPARKIRRPRRGPLADLAADINPIIA